MSNLNDPMKTEDKLLGILAGYQPEKMDFSRRGGGLNAVWKIHEQGRPMILKTYSARRSPLKTVLTNIDHMLTGRTSYKAAERCRVERRNLELWHHAGFSVPAVIDMDFPEPLPVDWLCMEYIDGRVLTDWLCDDSVSGSEKDAVFRLFAETIGRRHEVALRNKEPALVQEHASLDHLMYRAGELVAFDLEVSFRSRDIELLVYREICGYVRSIIRTFEDVARDHYIGLFTDAYPDRRRLKAINDEFLYCKVPLRRALYWVDRNIVKRNKRNTRYTAAEKLG